MRMRFRSLRAALSLALCVSHAAACTNYLKIVGGICATACINNTVSFCPRHVVVLAGGLRAGTCAAEGYRTPAGPLQIIAGPCGRMFFDQFVKSAPQRSSGNQGTLTAVPSRIPTGGAVGVRTGILVLPGLLVAGFWSSVKARLKQRA